MIALILIGIGLLVGLLVYFLVIKKEPDEDVTRLPFVSQVAVPSVTPPVAPPGPIGFTTPGPAAIRSPQPAPSGPSLRDRLAGKIYMTSWDASATCGLRTITPLPVVTDSVSFVEFKPDGSITFTNIFGSGSSASTTRTIGDASNPPPTYDSANNRVDYNYNGNSRTLQISPDLNTINTPQGSTYTLCPNPSPSPITGSQPTPSPITGSKPTPSPIISPGPNQFQDPSPTTIKTFNTLQTITVSKNVNVEADTPGDGRTNAISGGGLVGTWGITATRYTHVRIGTTSNIMKITNLGPNINGNFNLYGYFVDVFGNKLDTSPYTALTTTTSFTLGTYTSIIDSLFDKIYILKMVPTDELGCSLFSTIQFTRDSNKVWFIFFNRTGNTITFKMFGGTSDGRSLDVRINSVQSNIIQCHIGTTITVADDLSSLTVSTTDLDKEFINGIFTLCPQPGPTGFTSPGPSPIRSPQPGPSPA